MAVYPSSIKQFTTKRDVFDIDYAADINTLQDEVRAIQLALGINPQVANLNSGALFYPSVAARLDALEKGELSIQNEVDNLPVPAPTPPPTVTNKAILTCSVTNPYSLARGSGGTQINLTTTAWDTGAQADGVGITIQRDGFYHVLATARWGDPSGGSSTHHLSVRLGATNEILGSANVVSSYPVPAGAPGAGRVNASTIVKLTTGTPLRLWMYNTTSANADIYNLGLTTWFLSEA